MTLLVLVRYGESIWHVDNRYAVTLTIEEVMP